MITDRPTSTPVTRLARSGETLARSNRCAAPELRDGLSAELDVLDRMQGPCLRGRSHARRLHETSLIQNRDRGVARGC